MKRLYILSLLVSLPACSGDDSTSIPAPGIDASVLDTSTPDAGVGDDATVPQEDTGVSSDGADAGSDTGPASDAGCPTSWYVAPAVDPTIAVPDGGGGVLLHAIGSGTQDYVCKAGTNDAGMTYTWTLVTPDATLSDCHASVIGHHFASDAGAGFPEWQTTDGTYVVGQRHSVYTPDGGSGSLAWLLLNAVDAGGTGTLSHTAFVERLNTSGGNAPATGCDDGHVGATTNVAYTADYYFFGP